MIGLFLGLANIPGHQNTSCADIYWQKMCCIIHDV